MAERRMFAKTIIDSDAFLDMPLSTQSLYFHLSMRADDDGFINNPKKIMRMIGVNDDDIKVLLTKKFIINFESGVVVIKHWKIHNYIRGDRYKPTVYTEEKKQITEKNNKSYTLKSLGIPNDNQMDTIGIPVVDPGKDRLGKDRLGKDRLGKDSGKKCETVNNSTVFEDFWNCYGKKVDKEKTKKKFAKLKQSEIEKIKNHLPEYIKSTPDVKYRKNPLTYLNGKCWEDEIIQHDDTKTEKSFGTIYKELKAIDLNAPLSEDKEIQRMSRKILEGLHG